MIYRLLPREEWPKVEHIFEQFDRTLPGLGQIAVAEDNGAIVGMGVRQIAWHMEPWWMADGYHGKVSMGRLQQLLEAELEPGSLLYIFGPNEHIIKLAEAHGFRDTGWKVLCREV